MAQLETNVLDIKNAIRIEPYKSPKGYSIKLYIFECFGCKKEMKKSKYYIKKSTGYCSICASIKTHTKLASTEKEKKCRLCNNIRDITEFNKKGRHTNSVCIHCKNLHSVFKLNSNEYEIMLKLQDYSCAICKSTLSHIHQNGKKVKLAVDHCHKTGIIRGLLCTSCNIGLGNFKDNKNFLKNAIKYLEKTGDKSHGSTGT